MLEIQFKKFSYEKLMKDESAREIAEDLYFNHHSTPDDLLEKVLPEATYLFASNEDFEIVGMTSYKKITSTLAITERTIVFPKYRGKGYGNLISTCLESDLKTTGVRKIVCEILTFNLPMLFIKLKQGFLIEGLQRNHDRPGTHQYILGKDI